jgi:hypothetical protein
MIFDQQIVSAVKGNAHIRQKYPESKIKEGIFNQT